MSVEDAAGRTFSDSWHRVAQVRVAARFKLGKGLRDNSLQVTLLSTGPAFVVDRVEFDPIVAAQRRL